MIYFFVWKVSKEDLELFVWKLNGIEYSVQFTLEIKKKSIFTISGCGNWEEGRKADYKDIQKANSYTTVYTLGF